MCLDTRRDYAHNAPHAARILNETATRIDAQRYFSYWDRKTDTVHEWTPAAGSFTDWLTALGDEAVDCWKNHSISCANHVRYNAGQWSSRFSFNPRGQYVTYPGGQSSAWIDGDVTPVYEVPRAYDERMVQLPETGVNGVFACWYHWA